MNSQSLSSISFVISVVYTVTFANTFYLMTVKDITIPFSLNNMAWQIDKILCGIISLIMTLRYFFGNNQYISDVMSDSSRPPWIKFYHFSIIALQSIVLLICSYSISESISFVYGITSLFAIEVLWYLLALRIDRKGVWPDNKDSRMNLLYSELSNLSFIIGIVIVSNIACGVWILYLAFLLFLLNTAFDAKKNISTYMS